MALDVGAWDCFLLAGPYSVLRQEDEGLLDRCRRQAVSVLIGGPYMSGALAGGSTWRYRPIPEDIAADIARLRTLCAAHGVPLEAAALHSRCSIRRSPRLWSACARPSEVRQNVAFLRPPDSGRALA